MADSRHGRGAARGEAAAEQAAAQNTLQGQRSRARESGGEGNIVAVPKQVLIYANHKMLIIFLFITSDNKLVSRG